MDKKIAERLKPGDEAVLTAAHMALGRRCTRDELKAWLMANRTWLGVLHDRVAASEVEVSPVVIDSIREEVLEARKAHRTSGDEKGEVAPDAEGEEERESRTQRMRWPGQLSSVKRRVKRVQPEQHPRNRPGDGARSLEAPEPRMAPTPPEGPGFRKMVSREALPLPYSRETVVAEEAQHPAQIAPEGTVNLDLRHERQQKDAAFSVTRHAVTRALASARVDRTSLYLPAFLTEHTRAMMEQYLPPEVIARRVLLNAVVYLKLVAKPDPRFDLLPLHEAAAALCRESWTLYHNRETRVRELVHDLKDVFDEAFEATSYARGRHCTLVRLDLPQELEAAFETEYERRRRGEPLVERTTGSPWQSRHVQRLRETQLGQVRGSMLKDAPQGAVQLMEYLNTLPVRGFSDRYRKHREALYELIDAYYSDPIAHRAVSAFLEKAAAQPVPLYKATATTLRLSPANASPLGFKREMRRLFFDDCFEIDMASSQLALVAALWDVESIRRFLASGCSIWTSLLQHLLQAFPANTYTDADFEFVKEMLKKNTYAACYGMAQKNLKRFGNPDEMAPDEYQEYQLYVHHLVTLLGAQNVEAIGRVFLSHPVIKALLKARKAQMDTIKQQGGAFDCFGRWIAVTAHKKRQEGRSVPSVLAALSQNAELFVMLHLFDVVAAVTYDAAGRKVKRPPVQILLWQHDGFTFKPQNARDAETWLGRFERALERGCRALETKLGLSTIHTRLEVKYDPRNPI